MIAIIDSGGANIASVQFALERLGAESILTKDVKIIQSADKVLLPGVGAAPIAMQNLAEYGLIDCIRGLTQQVMGICLGMQLLFGSSEEGNTPCLGIIDAAVKKISPQPGLTIPHMGWNQVAFEQNCPLFKDIPANSWFYFVHSFAGTMGPWVMGSVSYGSKLPAVVKWKNFFGTQFHPERSAEAGSQLIRNFLDL